MIHARPTPARSNSLPWLCPQREGSSCGKERRYGPAVGLWTSGAGVLSWHAPGLRVGHYTTVCRAENRRSIHPRGKRLDGLTARLLANQIGGLQTQEAYPCRGGKCLPDTATP